MNQFFRNHVFAVLAAGLVSLATGADRVALVIGNNEYPADSNFHALNNCVNDARLLAKTLEEVGFEVTILTDASFSEMDEALLKFERDIPKGGTALVYFAGHGIEYQGQNYLMGSNAKLKARSRLGEEALKADTFAAALVQAGAKSSFLLLDCCREMPTSAEWAGRGQKKFGLADISISGDVVIGMAAAPGRQALEPSEAGGNSPYALALAKWIPSGLKHTDLFDEVRREVDGMTKGQQRTWENGSFLNPFYFAEKAEAKPKVDAPMTKKLAEMKAQFEAELERVRLGKEASEKALVAKTESMKKTDPSEVRIFSDGKSGLSGDQLGESFAQYLIEILSAEKEARKNKPYRGTEPILTSLTDAELDEKIAGLKAEAESADHGSAMKKTLPSTTPSMGLDKIFSASRGITSGQPFTSAVGTKFVWVEPGTFTMGSSEAEQKALTVPEAGGKPEYYENEPAHQVTISKGYWVGVHEVTIADYVRFLNESGQWDDSWVKLDDEMASPIEKVGSKYQMRSDKAITWGNEKLPMVMVSWDGAVAYSKWMNAEEASRLPSGYRFQLPSEAEWEKAARAGTTGMTYGGDLTFKGIMSALELDAIAWYGGNSGLDHDKGFDSSVWEGKQYNHSSAGTHPVGLKEPNDVGAYDMIGNVYEWCGDWYGKDYYSDGKRDPMGPVEGSTRVFRGGSWDSNAQFCRSAFRVGFTPSLRSGDVGFRVALSSLPAR